MEYVKRGKADHVYVFKRLNWKLVCTHSPVLQNYKTERESTLVTSDPLGNTAVTTGEESGTFLFKGSHLQSQVLSTTLGVSETDYIFCFSQLL